MNSPRRCLGRILPFALFCFIALGSQAVGQTFNGSAFSIPDSGVVQNNTVSVGATGTVTSVMVTLTFSSAARPDDLDFLLVAPNGTSNLEFLSDGGGTAAIANTTVTLSDSGAT